MERPDLLKAGDEVEMSESKLNTLAGTMYYYTIEPALAMSDNIPALRRLTSLHATVKEVKYENSVYTWLHIVSRPTGMLFWECVGPLKKMAKKGHFCDIFKPFGIQEYRKSFDF